MPTNYASTGNEGVNRTFRRCKELEAENEQLRARVAELEAADEIERLRDELKTAHNAIISDVNQRRDLAECRRLLREAVLRDGLCDERWFQEAAQAAGGESE